MFDYNIYPNNSNKKFLNACVTIEKKYPDNKKRNLLVDVDGTTIQIYYINNKKVTVYDDFEVGAVYVLSELDLKDIFKN